MNPILFRRLTAAGRRWLGLTALLGAVATGAARPAEAQTVPAGYTISRFVTGLPGSPSQLTDDPATGTLYFAARSSILYSVTSTGTVSTVTSGFTSGDFNPYAWTDIKFVAGSVYIATSTHLDKVDLTSNTATLLASGLTGFGSECGIAAVGNVLYITSGNNSTDEMDTFDLTTNSLTTVNSSLPNYASSLQYNPVANKLYFATVNGGKFYQYDPVTNTYTLIATETNGSDANFAVDPTGQNLYVRVSGGVDQIAIADGTITHFATGLPGGPSSSDVIFGPSSSGSDWSLYVTSGNSIYEIGSFPGLAAPTTTALASSANPSVFGQPVTYTATVSGGDGGGTVQFTEDGANVGSPVALTGGVATYTDSALAPGSHPVAAVYSGDAASATSTDSSLTQIVNQADTTTTVTISANPATDIQPLDVTATVAATAPGAGTPTGTVEFAVDGTNVGQSVALVNGVATYHYAGGVFLPGSHTITATYSGDTDFLADAPGQATETLTPSAASQLTVTAPPTATAGNAFSATVTALDALGQIATGYTGTIHLTSTDGQAVLPADAALINGVGQFTVTLETAGTQTVTATDTLTAALTGVSGGIVVSAATAGQITFTQQPTTTVAGGAITPAPSVAVTDAFGNPIAGTTVTVSLIAGTGALSGTVTQTTDATGVAAFPGLAISRPGQKTLQAASGISLAAASDPFTVTADDALTGQGVNVSAIKRVSFTAPVATFTDTDAASPASDFTATIDWGDGTTSAGTVSGGFTVAGTHAYATEGIYTITTALTDTQPGGPTSQATSQATVQDVTTPATTAVLNPTAPNGSNGYYTTPVVVTLTATDPDDTSSEITTFYTIDGGAQQTYTVPFKVGGDAAHTVTFFSKDAAGNAEAAQSVSFQIDATPPVTAGSATAGLVTLSATDAFSGVAATTYSIDGGASQTYAQPFKVSGAGTHTVTFSSVDVAGNAEPSKTLSLTVAAPPLPTPTVLHTFPAGLQMIAVTESYGAAATALSPAPSKLAVWSPSILQYTLLGAAAPLAPGQGYWVRLGQSADLLDTGTPTPTGQPFTVTLQKGWNMIGDPFPSAVSLGGVTVRNSAGKTFAIKDANLAGLLSLTLYSYPAGAGAYQATGADGSLAPYTGYWAYAFQPCSLSLPAPVAP